MPLRERIHHEDEGPGADGPAGGGGLDAARNAARDLLAAGDDAIKKALSKRNSEQFLSAVRQEGGE